MAVVYGYRLPVPLGWRRDTVVGFYIGIVGFALATAAVAVFRDPAAGARFLVVGGSGTLAFGAIAVLLRQQTASGGTQPVTLATWVTLCRGVLVCVFGGFVAAVGLSTTGPAAWLPGFAFGVAAVLDRVDGWLARARDAETALGERLDIETDAILVFAGAVAVVAEGLAPVAFLAAGVARYLFLVGHRLRRYRGQTVGDEHRRRLNRLVYVVLTVAIWVAVLPVTAATTTRPLLVLVAVPFLLNFLRSWLATRH